MARPSIAAAVAEVASRDPVIAGLIKRTTPFKLRPAQSDHFAALVRAICYQQLAGAAAAAIHGRLATLYDGTLTHRAVLATRLPALRKTGLSAAKIASIRDLAAHVADGSVPLDRIARLSDEEVIERLTIVRGIGRWTAEMFLIFQLRRLDVWPVDDYGVRKGFALAYGLADLPKPKELQLRGEPFRPYRTIVAWYCWRAVGLARARR
jgi:DNA-3-methyladenine glycosylase II